MKRVTFSFDDGTLQDRRLVALLNEYGMKATFNLCSNEWGQIHTIGHLGVAVDHSELPETEVEELYKGHEVACHTKTHPSNLDELSAETVVTEVEENRRALELLVGYPITGLAYPWGKCRRMEAPLETKQRELTCLQKRMDNLIEMRADGDLSREMFRMKTEELEPKMQKLQKEIEELSAKHESKVIVDYKEKLTVLQYALSQYSKISSMMIKSSGGVTFFGKASNASREKL